ncbi:MAG: hypothetical protein CMP67_10705 [Flavobacteriales bacterium]|nr:hypothetical protein [Flavobacteriales bacterium]MBO72390.1 hypothetical protein [Flavobacteriales bacterium]|tara:strand:+ start:482 stop:847 length:366 start_codon:yes stop_codon:yes gene_type:complete
MFFKTHVRWVEVLSNTDFINNYVENEIHPLTVEAKSCLATKYDKKLRVFDDLCPHQAISLKDANCSGGMVICSWHKYAYCLKSGKDLSTSGNSLKVYQTKLENERWYVGVEEKLPFWMDPM